MGDLTNNFSKREFEASSTAAKHKINNKIPLEYEDNLIRLANMLQAIRDAYGQPIIIGSGFRCDKLNKMVGGVANSDHRFCAACDIHSKSDTLKDNKKLWDVIMELVKKKIIVARQIIWEYGKRGIGMDWIHISVNNDHNVYKTNQILYIGV